MVGGVDSYYYKDRVGGDYDAIQGLGGGVVGWEACDEDDDGVITTMCMRKIK